MAEKKLLEQLADRIRMKHYSRKTESAYVEWARRFILFHGKRHPREMGTREIEAYLNYLANVRRVSASTQNQCLYAILFMYREVLGVEIGNINAMRAKEGKRLPTVLNQQDTLQVLNCVDGDVFNLMARLLYGAGLRLKECQQLRIKDVDFGMNIITVRGGKGDKDRTVPLPRSLVKPLMDQMNIARHLWNIDRQRGMPGVYVPDALEVKYPNTSCEWGWFWVFPAQSYSVDPVSKIRRRHHQHESELQRAIRAGAIRAGVVKRVTPHIFRHCFATHLLWKGYDIRTVQELMGHKSIKTTMVYLHILHPGGWKGVESPLDNVPVESIIRQ
ncbi:MAG TPA: integron integrase [Anaerolineales bacterium]|nr:integron integrase [Anaerolineales bacterium]